MISTDEALKERATAIAQKVNESVFDKLDDQVNCLMTIALMGYMIEIANEINSKHVPEAFTGRDFRLCIARACRKIAGEIQSEH